MNVVVDISKYNKKSRGRKMNGVENMKELELRLIADYDEKHNHNRYTEQEIDRISNHILSFFAVGSKNISTPIVKIAKKFDFKICKKMLDDNLSGDIYINGDTFEKYGHDRIILVNKNDQLYHQRFVIAHELAHYLFDFLGNPQYKDKKILFSDTYFRNDHNRPEELIANRFAASILMPKGLFVKQYNLALESGLEGYFVSKFLSEFFETSLDSIDKRIKEVMD